MSAKQAESSVNAPTHVPVLLAEVMQALDIKPGAVVVDATYGRGGHAEAILKRLNASGRLLVIDQDPEAAADARRRLGTDARVIVEHARFSQLPKICAQRGLRGQVTAMLFDLGVSSPQLDEAGRGFSFRHSGPLDMRMNPEEGTSAARWLEHADEAELASVLQTYGEERHAKRIARAVVRARVQSRITQTQELARVVADAVPARERGKDPATRTFQAIRIYINREIEELETVLPQIPEMLAPGGRVAVISFHSLEDRRVKHFLRAESRAPSVPRSQPLPANAFHPRLRLIGRAIRPTAEETKRNPRARSAVLRVAERIGATRV
jgi:16S rRNA (cytosine1402-N4)-methyltransferase